MLLKVLVKLVVLLNYDVLLSRFVTLSTLLCSYTRKQLLGRVWVFGRSKFGILGEKGLETVTFLTEQMTVQLSEHEANDKRAVTVSF